MALRDADDTKKCVAAQFPSVERLTCAVKEYSWGKRGSSSEVGLLYEDGGHGAMSETTPYAELWAGTHPDGPAHVRSANEPLSQRIARFATPANNISNNNASESGENEIGENRHAFQEHIHLPFIMKIMSIDHSLSLQVHPSKEQAAKLHRKDPQNYPDQNHKPELAYALSRFELLCGFRPPAEIIANMNAFVELRDLMGEEHCHRFKTLFSRGFQAESAEMKGALRQCFASMMAQQVNAPALVQTHLQSFFDSLNLGGSVKHLRGCLSQSSVDLMFKTYKRFPVDVGCFAPLLLNHIVLEPGECCYYGPGELHAYLSGECVECVGCSNNTIRAGLTPKFVDRDNLIRVLNWRMTSAEFYLVPPRRLFPDFAHVTEFMPAECDDFILHKIEIDDEKLCEKQRWFDIPTLSCPSMLILTDGHAICQERFSPHENADAFNVSGEKLFSVKRGEVFFIPAGRTIRFKTGEKLTAFRTFSHAEGPAHHKLAKATKTQKTLAHDFDASAKRHHHHHHAVICNNSNNKTKPMFLRASDNENNNNNNTSLNRTKPVKKSMTAFADPLMFDVSMEMDGFV